MKVTLGKKYVYAHLVNGQIFYIGKGSLGRAFSEGCHNKVWRQIVADAGGFDVEILFESCSDVEVRAFEASEIRSKRPQANLFIQKVRLEIHCC